MNPASDTVRVGPVDFPAAPRSTAQNPAHRAEEDLAFGARDTLEDIRLHGLEFAARQGRLGLWDTWQALLMDAVKPVARHFQVDADALLEGWVRHYGPGLFAASGKMVRPRPQAGGQAPRARAPEARAQTTGSGR